MSTTSELDEMEAMVTVLEGALEELPTLIFLMKVGLHQGRARLREGELPILTVETTNLPLVAEVEVEAEV